MLLKNLITISKYILLKYILLKREIQKDIFKKLSIRHKKVCFCIFYFFVFLNFVKQPISVNSDIYRFWNVIRGIIRVIGDGIIYGNAVMRFSDSGISMSSTRQLFRQYSRLIVWIALNFDKYQPILDAWLLTRFLHRGLLKGKLTELLLSFKK